MSIEQIQTPPPFGVTTMVSQNEIGNRLPVYNNNKQIENRILYLIDFSNLTENLKDETELAKKMVHIYFF